MRQLKWVLIAGIVFSWFFMSGCESKWGTAGLGAAGGAAAGAGSYEYVMNREMNRIEDAYESGEMQLEEYQIRKDQIERMSLLK